MQQLVMEIDTVYITSENSEPKFEQILSYAGPIKANYMQYAHLNILNQNSSSSLPSTKQYLTPKYSEPKFEQILSYAGPSNANCMQYAHPNILNQNSSRFCHMLPNLCKLYANILNHNSSRFSLVRPSNANCMHIHSF